MASGSGSKTMETHNETSFCPLFVFMVCTEYHVVGSTCHTYIWYSNIFRKLMTGEHSAIFLNFTNLYFAIKIFLLSILRQVLRRGCVCSL